MAEETVEIIEADKRAAKRILFAVGYLGAKSDSHMRHAVAKIIAEERTSRLILTEHEKEWAINYLIDQFVAANSGDGMEEDFALDGFPDHKGYNNYTDEELFAELEEHVGSEEDAKKIIAGENPNELDPNEEDPNEDEE